MKPSNRATLKLSNPKPLSRFPVHRDRLAAVDDDLTGDDTFADRVLRRDRVHDLEHQLFDDDLEAACADVALQRFFGDGFEGVVVELERDVLETHDGLILTNERVLRLAEDLDQRAFVELIERSHDRQASHKLGDETEL